MAVIVVCRWPLFSPLGQAKMMQTRGETAKAMLTVQQASEASERRFPLSDLLNVPIQRVLKYPLLMKVSGRGLKQQHVSCCDSRSC